VKGKACLTGERAGLHGSVKLTPPAGRRGAVALVADQNEIKELLDV